MVRWYLWLWLNPKVKVKGCCPLNYIICLEGGGCGDCVISPRGPGVYYCLRFVMSLLWWVFGFVSSEHHKFPNMILNTKDWQVSNMLTDLVWSSDSVLICLMLMLPQVFAAFDLNISICWNYWAPHWKHFQSIAHSKGFLTCLPVHTPLF